MRGPWKPRRVRVVWKPPAIWLGNPVTCTLSRVCVLPQWARALAQATLPCWTCVDNPKPTHFLLRFDRGIPGSSLPLNARLQDST